MSNNETAQWLTVAQVAQRLNISERTVQRRCEKGRLTAQRVTTDEGVAWRIDPLSLPDNLPTGAVHSADNSPSPVPTTADDSGTNDRGAASAPPSNDRNTPTTAVMEPTTADSTFRAVAGEVHQLRGEIEQLKSFIAGGAMQALTERLTQLPDENTLRKLIADDREQNTQFVTQAIQKGIAEALQSEAFQMAEAGRAGESEKQTITKEDITQAVQQGIQSAVAGADHEEREATAQAISDAQKPVMQGISKLLERMQWLEEDNANLRKELEEQRGQGFFGRLFGKKKAE